MPDYVVRVSIEGKDGTQYAVYRRLAPGVDNFGYVVGPWPDKKNAQKIADTLAGETQQAITSWTKWPIWLVWSLDDGNTLSLREVSTSSSRAREILKTVKNGRRIVRAWIEPREANHLFGHRDVNWGVGDNITEEIMRRMKPAPPEATDE